MRTLVAAAEPEPRPPGRLVPFEASVGRLYELESPIPAATTTAGSFANLSVRMFIDGHDATAYWPPPSTG